MTGIASILNRTVSRKPGRFVIALVWVVFTVSLLAWWIYFGFHQVQRLSALGYPDALELARFQSMLMWEGGTLIALIVAGGGAGIYLLARELRTQGEIRSFFAAFTHEMRTSLSSLLIRIESLEAVGGGSASRQLAAEVERMRLQLDNALFATVSAEGGLHRESLQLIDVVRRVAERFTELSVATIGNVHARVHCDPRAFESMISNLLSNALVHGKAGGVTVTVGEEPDGMISLQFTDDGCGFAGKPELLGRKFARHYDGSGAGLGLAITSELAHRSGGTFRCTVGKGKEFIATLFLKRAAPTAGASV